MALEFQEDVDGCYAVCVFNAEECSEAELNEMFGRFGTIVRVNRHGQATFISYRTRGEATQCYETMIIDERFIVKPARRKGRSNAGRTSLGRGAMKNPELIPFPSYLADEKPSQSLPMAKVVVIGNLHPNMKQCNVYKLCTAAHIEPLDVAMKTMKKPPYPTISYAFVHLRNDEEVQNIIDSLNNLQINGYTLVVESSDKLCGK